MRDFIRALRAVYALGDQAVPDDEPLQEDAFDWSALARVSAPFFRRAPGISCMLGPMDAAPKARSACVWKTWSTYMYACVNSMLRMHAWAHECRTQGTLSQTV